MAPLAELHRRLVEIGPQGPAERLLLALLVPAGWLYGLLGRLRVLLYRSGLLPVYRAPVPVISVGNLAVGGTGKTPMVDHLVRHLLERGQKVAVVSRGYGGRRRRGVGVVSAGSGPLLAPEQCGDEPYLLARRNPRALVLVAPRRADGVRLAVERFGAGVVILDDGFQHLAVARDLDVVLLDARRPLGNGHVLPAGALREFPSALRRGDLFVLTRCRDGLPSTLPVRGPLLRSRHVLAETAVTLQGEVISLQALSGRPGAAFAGLADPGQFFAALATAGLRLEATLALPDHAAYGPAELGRIAEAARGADFLLTTEKDGVKLLGADFPVPCYQVPMRLEFSEPGELVALVDQLLSRGGDHDRGEGTA